MRAWRLTGELRPQSSLATDRQRAHEASAIEPGRYFEIERALSERPIDGVARRPHDYVHDLLRCLAADPTQVLLHFPNAIAVDVTAAPSLVTDGPDRCRLMQSDSRQRPREHALGAGQEDERAGRRAIQPGRA